MRRARGRHQDPIPSQQPDAARRQLAVSLNRAFTFRLSLRQRRRIEHDEIKFLLFRILQPRERIPLRRLMTTLRHGGQRLIQREVPPRTHQRVRADIQIRDRLRPATRRVEREAAGEAERIQNLTPIGQRSHPMPVLALIQEEPGLLPTDDVRLEAQSILQKRDDAIRLGTPG